MSLRQADRWRGRVKVAIASAIAGACRLEQHVRRAREQRRPLILGYHRVVRDFVAAAKTEMPSMLISQAMFERHVESIGRHFRFVGLDEIGERVAAGRPFDEPVAAITFDDGYRDVYENAFPFLRRKGVPAALFVVTDLISRPVRQTHDRLYYLVDKAFNEWDDPRRRLVEVMIELQIPTSQLFRSRGALTSAMTAVTALLPMLTQSDVVRLMKGLELHVGQADSKPGDDGSSAASVDWSEIDQMRRGGFTIGSHTRTHASLPMESPEAVCEELEGSKRILERHLGEPVHHFAYPGGEFTASVVEALQAAGYRYAYTACSHADARNLALTQQRLLLWEGSSLDADGRFSPAVFNCQIHDLWPPARRCERTHRL